MRQKLSLVLLLGSCFLGLTKEAFGSVHSTDVGIVNLNIRNVQPAKAGCHKMFQPNKGELGVCSCNTDGCSGSISGTFEYSDEAGSPALASGHCRIWCGWLPLNATEFTEAWPMTPGVLANRIVGNGGYSGCKMGSQRTVSCDPGTPGAKVGEVH